MWVTGSCGGRRPHQSLASVGVAALVRLIVAAGDRMSTSVWVEAITTLHNCVAETRPVRPCLHLAPEIWCCWCLSGGVSHQVGNELSPKSAVERQRLATQLQP